MEKIEPVALAKALRKVWKTSSENSLLISQAADAIDALQAEVARLTKERDEAVAKVKWFEGEQPSIAGWPWDSPYMDGVEIGKREAREQLDAMTKEREEAAAIRARGGDKR